MAAEVRASRRPAWLMARSLFLLTKPQIIELLLVTALPAMFRAAEAWLPATAGGAAQPEADQRQGGGERDPPCRHDQVGSGHLRCPLLLPGLVLSAHWAAVLTRGNGDGDGMEMPGRLGVTAGSDPGS
ncbi:MAG: hypothetical protein ACRDNF_23660 [Streptosporangiaceae bacterium]